MQSVRTERRRDYQGLTTNTDIWSSFALRPDDIIVDTPSKYGTTWMLNIVMMLIHGRVVPDAGNRKEAPWLDCGFRDRNAMAKFFASGTSNKWEGRLTDSDFAAYSARIETLLDAEDVAWVNWGDRRTP